jgi:hypothetical protein
MDPLKRNVIIRNFYVSLFVRRSVGKVLEGGEHTVALVRCWRVVSIL